MFNGPATYLTCPERARPGLAVRARSMHERAGAEDMAIISRLALLALVTSSPAFSPALSPALAQSGGNAEVIRGLCRQEGCDEFTIVSKESMAESDHGILFRTRVRTFLANSQ